MPRVLTRSPIKMPGTRQCRLARRLAAGLSPAEIRRLDTATEEDIEAFVTDGELSRLVDQYAAVRALPLPERQARLFETAWLELSSLIDVGDRRAMLFVVYQANRARHPVRHLVKLVVERFENVRQPYERRDTPSPAGSSPETMQGYGQHPLGPAQEAINRLVDFLPAQAGEAVLVRAELEPAAAEAPVDEPVAATEAIQPLATLAIPPPPTTSPFHRSPPWPGRTRPWRSGSSGASRSASPSSAPKSPSPTTREKWPGESLSGRSREAVAAFHALSPPGRPCPPPAVELGGLGMPWHAFLAPAGAPRLLHRCPPKPRIEGCDPRAPRGWRLRRRTDRELTREAARRGEHSRGILGTNSRYCASGVWDVSRVPFIPGGRSGAVSRPSPRLMSATGQLLSAFRLPHPCLVTTPSWQRLR